MGSHHNIHLPFFQVRNAFLLFRSRTEPAEQIHPYREILHPLRKGVVNLLRKNSCRRKVSHLFVFLDSLKCGTDGNLCLSVSDVPADQAVHDFGAFHVPLGSFNCQLLVLRFLKWKQLLKLPLPDRVGSVHVTVFFLSLGIQFY